MKIKTHTKNVLRLLPIIFGMMLLCRPVQAQVAFGSMFEPNEGALLDLKEWRQEDGEANATKGMILPRVSLTDMNKLYPMLPEGYNPIENARHIGLVVYHMEKCVHTGVQILEGIYVWNGTKWDFVGQGRKDYELALGVQKHDAKPGVYEEFYSNNFGQAGRWMITNLTAWKYDGINHSQDPGGNATEAVGTPRTLKGPSYNDNNSYDAAFWCYPNGGPKRENSTALDNNPLMGLLYTWDAATAGKGGDNGEKNIYNTSGGTAANDESNIPEGNDSGKQQRIQGICPQGWHLPSDYEWNLLEQEIYEHPKKYSSYENSSPFPNAGKWNTSWNTARFWRPAEDAADAHGKAMKGDCGANGINPDGNSLPLKQGGFNALLAGGALRGNTTYFGNYAFFCSSSSRSSSHSSGSRHLSNASAGVLSTDVERSTMESVRCVKD